MYADVTILLDRSGSMDSMKEAAVAGINKFITDVKSEPGEGCWTLATFDDQHSAKGAGERFPHYVFSAVPDAEVPTLNDFAPRGGTALVDAFCKVILDIRERLATLLEIERQNRKVMIVVITDGQENQSIEFTSEKLRELVGEAQGKEGWEFIYLGANQDAFAVAAQYNVTRSMNYAGLTAGSVTANSYEATPTGIAVAIASGAIGCRAWKADGNDTAAAFLSDPAIAKSNTLISG